MLQNTLLRMKGFSPVFYPMVIGSVEHRFLIAEQLRQINVEASAIILEPVGRNTAPAVALAAIRAVDQDKDAVLLVLPADHVINNRFAFHNAVRKALPPVQDGKLVTFGTVPTYPETGFGYIKSASMNDISPVIEFVEKPDLNTAIRYLDSGRYLWNSGVFVFKASQYLEELKKFSPDIHSACQKALSSECSSDESDLDFVRLNEEAFTACPDDSIDCAVMEKTEDAVVIPLDAGWADVGSWSSLADLSLKDSKGNSTLGDVVLHDSSNTYVRSEKKLIATVGVRDLVVVESDDAFLVAHKDSVQDVKTVVKQLTADGRPEVHRHRKVYRPWGSYDSVEKGPFFKVKRITVKPGGKLSLQKHFHRAEHWVVVKGMAKVRNGDQETYLTENQSTYIPIGAIHRLENPGKFDLELIEIQSGSYLGEDDIVRLEDNYGRDNGLGRLPGVDLDGD